MFDFDCGIIYSIELYTVCLLWTKFYTQYK